MTLAHPSVQFLGASAPLVRRLSFPVMALLLFSAGTMHFLRPAMFVRIVPPVVPWPLAAVYASGAAELLLAAGLLFRRLSQGAALGAAGLFVALFPANVYHWLANIHLEGAAAPGWYHWVRLPTQGLLVGWALWLWRSPREPETFQ
jgi:uncharacterized membrane protein